MSENLPQTLKFASNVADFNCALCGECCSDKWKIKVDDVSYHKLQQKLTLLGREHELQDNFIYSSRTLQIRFLDNGKCPYLSRSNLCQIHLELGTGYLLDICKTFPRQIFRSTYALEFSLLLTCKTAVSTLQHRPIKIIEAAWPIEDKEEFPFSFIQPNTISNYLPDMPIVDQLPYHQLETTFIKILQDRRYPIGRRLVFLGQELTLLLDGQEMCDVSLLPFEIPTDLNRHLAHFFFLSNIFEKRYTSENMSQLLESILLSITSKQTLVAPTKIRPPSPHDYQTLLDEYYVPANRELSLILENYLVNSLLNKHFYLQPLHLAYYRLAFTYAAIIAFSIGHSIIDNQPLSQQTALQAIYDVESIFFTHCFYPRAANYQTGQSPIEIVENGIALANI